MVAVMIIMMMINANQIDRGLWKGDFKPIDTQSRGVTSRAGRRGLQAQGAYRNAASCRAGICWLWWGEKDEVARSDGGGGGTAGGGPRRSSW